MQDSTVIDGSTERHLARLARESGYFQREFNPEPTRAVLSQAGIDYAPIQDIEMDTGEIATVYSLDLKGEPDQKLEEDLIAHGATAQAFATDWAVDTNHGYDHLTYYFDSAPTKHDIEKARIVNKVKHAIEIGKLNQQFSCRTCGRRVHWTDLVPPTPENEVAYKQRILMLRDEQCSCCNEKGNLEHITHPNQVDEYVQARPMDVMAAVHEE